MAIPTNDPRFDEYSPPKCKDCGKPLQFAFEIEQGELCSMCGPGSLKYQQRENREHDVAFVQQSTEYNDMRGQYELLANRVRTAIDHRFDDSSVSDLRTALDEGEKTLSNSRLNTNAEATEARMRETVNPGQQPNQPVVGEEMTEHSSDYQTKDV